MKDLDRSIVESLDGRDGRLLPFLPYLLQDLWEIGASPDAILELLGEHRLGVDETWHVLDLGCGKGAVSIPLARELGVRVHGIDACEGFVQDARQRAAQHGVADACTFELADIRERVDHLAGYDLAILGSIGPVLGDVGQTLGRVRTCVKPGRWVVLDDAYTPDASALDHPAYQTRAAVLAQIRGARMAVREERGMAPEAVTASAAEIYGHIARRARELIARHPALAQVFEGYVEAQAAEIEVLEHHVVCVTWLLERTD